ncbi:MAG: hypothetical protein Q7S74_03900 [Nanoarchaeota archaeon]|nr:hypothetical protein [Nanoarchaeota archaeon]
MKNKVNKDSYRKTLFQGIKDFEEIEKELLEEGSNMHLFINTASGEVKIFMVTLLLYLNGKNPYYPQEFHEDFFNSQLQLMHRTCLASLHIAVQASLNEFIKSRNLTIEISLAKQIDKIVKNIREKLLGNSLIEKELREIEHLGGNHPQFQDYLNTVLSNIIVYEDLETDKKYKEATRAYFDALSIVRNKVSHYTNEPLSENEKERLKRGHFGKMVDENGYLQMDIRFYKLIFGDIIKFLNFLKD